MWSMMNSTAHFNTCLIKKTSSQNLNNANDHPTPPNMPMFFVVFNSICSAN